MPSLTITDDEFLKLSEPTQEELLDLFRESFAFSNESSNSVLGHSWIANHNDQQNWFSRLRKARIAKASKS
jgi:hypothetical protein